MTFREKVYEYYTKERRDFPWRRTRDPYRILVSEVMLQQTQARRVIKKYEEFIQKFPDVRSLAQAPFSAVLKVWQGLGYNRRALSLHRAATAIVKNHKGKVPLVKKELVDLPGIGPSTASAVRTFSANQPEVFIETNIRTVYIHEFFAGQKNIPDKVLLPLVEKTLDRQNPRAWYYALMDYGVHLKKLHQNPSRRSAHHTKQSKFEGSDRQLRGQIIRALLENKRLTKLEMIDHIKSDPKKIKKILTSLVKDRLIIKKGSHFTIA